MVTYLFYSGLLPPTTFLTICQHFPPLLNQIFATNSIVISARIPSMLPTQSLGGTRNTLSIHASIAWPSIISLFLVGYLFFFLQMIKLIYLLATSMEVECMFSQGRLLLSHIRSQLSVQSTRALMCLGVWSKLGFITDSDIKAAVVILPELIGEEEEELGIHCDRISD